jgi:hypothetical protein
MDRLIFLPISLANAYPYARRTALPMSSRISDPAIATRKDVRLNPVTVMPKTRFAKNPPTRAPTIPNKVVPKMPPRFGVGSIAWATTPTINPNIIHDKTFINISPP